MTIQELQQDLGFEVEVRHYRYPIDLQDGRTVYSDVPIEDGQQIDPNRGCTVVDIFYGDNLVATGMATCGNGDNFNKRIGRQLALGRAIYQLDLKNRRPKVSTV